MTGIGRGRAAAAVATTVVLVTLLGAVASPPVAAAVRGVTIDARVDEKRVRDSSELRPIRLSPKASALVVVEVTNGSDRPIDVRTVRLEGKVAGLTFFAYDTAVAMTVVPGAKGIRRFPLDLGGLGGRATGLMPTAVKLLDVQRNVVAEETGVADVRGSLFSVYGWFGIGIAALTAMSLIGVLIGLARRRLPSNRWRRSLRFLVPGIGVGILLNFALAALRVFVPGVTRWLIITIVSALVFFGLGQLPPPADEHEQEGEEEDEEAPLAPPAFEEAPPVPALEAWDEPLELDAAEGAPALPLDAEDNVVEAEVGEAPPAPPAPPAFEEAPPVPPLEAPDEPVELDAAEEAPALPLAAEEDIAEAEVPEPADASPAPAVDEVAPVAPPAIPTPAPAPVPAPEVAARLPIVVPCHLPPEDEDVAAEIPTRSMIIPRPWDTSTDES